MITDGWNSYRADSYKSYISQRPLQTPKIPNPNTPKPIKPKICRIAHFSWYINLAKKSISWKKLMINERNDLFRVELVGRSNGILFMSSII